MFLERARFISVQEQHADVKGATNKETYKTLYRKYFIDSEWPGLFYNGLQELPENASQPDFFGLWGLQGVLASQYGFPTVLDVYLRKDRKGYKKPLLEPRYGLAFCIYTAKVIEQATPVKQEMIDLMKTPTLNKGILGQCFPISEGRVLPPNDSVPILRVKAKERLRLPRPIAEVDTDTVAKLATVDFSFADSQGMSDTEFATQVFPEVSPILQPFVAPEVVFSLPQSA